MRLDHFIAKTLQISERDSRHQIVSGSIEIDKLSTIDLHFDVDRFSEVRSEGKVIRKSTKRLHIMIHKPEGILSATTDNQHETVIDLIDHPAKNTLHLAGRLDRSSTGLVLLTNDSAWSEALTSPDEKTPKVYLVETDRPIPEQAIVQFAEGFRFETEGITTLPAKLEILGDQLARVTLYEGRYHQIKRMFHRINESKLKSLHRESIGRIILPKDLPAGKWRPLSAAEVSLN